MSDLTSMSEAVNGEDPWTDEAFASPLADVSEQAAHPGDRALQWSLASMVLVLTAVILPVLGALPPLLAAGRAMRLLALLPPAERRRVPMRIRRRVGRRSMTAAGFAVLFTALWLVYLL
jgi:hypothetical protein